MKAKFRVLTLLLMLILFGVAADSCDRKPGRLVRINRDGMDYTMLGSIIYNEDFFYGYYGGFVRILGTPVEKLFANNHSEALVINRNGRREWVQRNWNAYVREIISWDGNYLYYRNKRRFLSDINQEEKTLPDSLYENQNLYSVSDDNRYLCFYRSYYDTASNESNGKITLWDAVQNSARQVLLPLGGYISSAVYVSHLDKIYYLNQGALYRVSGDGSISDHILSISNYGHAREMTLLPGENTLLIMDRNTLCIMDLPSHTVRERIETRAPYSSMHDNLYAYAPYSQELYYIINNQVWRYDLQSRESSLVYRGGKHAFDLHTGIACSWDGDYIYLAGKQ